MLILSALTMAHVWGGAEPDFTLPAQYRGAADGAVAAAWAPADRDARNFGPE